MRIIAVKALRKFWSGHPNAEQALRAWYEEVSQARWVRPADLKAQYGNASILKDRRVVFNIKGNVYCLVVAVAYNTGIVFVKFIGTHKAYDAIDAQTVEME